MDYLELADDYLHDRIDEETKLAFESKMEQDEQLRLLVEELKLLKAGMQRHHQHQLLARIKATEKLQPISLDQLTEPSQYLNAKPEVEEQALQQVTSALLEQIRAESQTTIINYKEGSKVPISATNWPKKRLLVIFISLLLLSGLVFLIWNSFNSSPTNRPTAAHLNLFESYFIAPDLGPTFRERSSGDSLVADIIDQFEQDNFEQAAKKLQRKIKQESEVSIWDYYQGIAYLGDRLPQKALAAFNRYFASVGPNVLSDYLYYYRALAHILSNDSTAALSELDKISAEATDIITNVAEIKQILLNE